MRENLLTGEGKIQSRQKSGKKALLPAAALGVEKSGTLQRRSTEQKKTLVEGFFRTPEGRTRERKARKRKETLAQNEVLRQGSEGGLGEKEGERRNGEEEVEDSDVEEVL